VKKEEIRASVADAIVEIEEKLNKFGEELDKETDDPDHFITMTELERKWHQLSLETSKTYSTTVSRALNSFDTKELRIAKKGSSSRKESD